jgi:uncharacterized protein YneF (UPF0154 family)
MKKNNRKGQIELSANFIVIIIISVVILVGGLALFFKMKNSAQSYVDKLDAQTEENIKSMMLSSGYRVAVYPQDLSISNGNGKMIGIGITNIFTIPTEFTIRIKYINRYATASSLPDPVLPTTDYNLYFLMSGNKITDKVTVQPNSQITKGILLSLPKTAGKGQYVYTIEVLNDTQPYGTLQVYVDNT